MNKIQQVLDLSKEFIPGNEWQIKLGLIAIILNKHLLIEDVPGMGKTTFVKFFSKVSGLNFKRIQFTNDLLPSDVIGVNIYQKETEKFIFKPGPIFGELILADELNRASPKSQSALLEVMEEKQISVDGVTYLLPDHFCLMATQNPRHQMGTQSLPESQMDRFLFKFSMGKLSHEAERKLFLSGARSDQVKNLSEMFHKKDIIDWREKISKIIISDTMMDYIMRVITETRNHQGITGLSSRAGFDLIDAVKGWAFLNKRDYSIPDDLQAVFPYVAGHRMYQQGKINAEKEFLLAQDFLKSLPLIKLA